VAALAKELAPKVGADPDAAEQAAKLAKCDLVTQTVVEFTSLQGQIGAQMYRTEQGLLTPQTRRAPSVTHSGDTSPVNTVEDKQKASKSPPPQSGGGAEALAKAEGVRDVGRADKNSSANDIATAIEQHYKPQGPSDAVPTNPVAVAVALADKLDTLVGFWAIDELPTGSKDPFALRRAILGAHRIVLENNIKADLGDFAKPHALKMRLAIEGKKAEEAYRKGMKMLLSETNTSNEEIERLIQSGLRLGSKVTINNEEIFVPLKDYSDGKELVEWMNTLISDLDDFSEDRLRVHLRDKGFRHDIVDATFALGGENLVTIVNRVTALQSFLGTSEGENLLAGYKRAANILKAEAKKGDLPSGDIDTLSQKEALALQQALSKAKPAIEAALTEESYSTAMTALSQLRAPIDAFFDNVMVVSEVKEDRENNLRLLGLIRDTARQIADFDRING